MKTFCIISVDSISVAIVIVALILLIFGFKSKNKIFRYLSLAILGYFLFVICLFTYQFLSFKKNSTFYQHIQPGELQILNGEMAFRRSDFTKNGDHFGLKPQDHNDSIRFTYDHINLFVSNQTRYSEWCIVYLDSQTNLRFQEFLLDSLVKEESKVIVRINAKKIKDNQWEGIQLLEIKKEKGMPSEIL